jgi:hypothetical protein
MVVVANVEKMEHILKMMEANISWMLEGKKDSFLVSGI